MDPLSIVASALAVLQTTTATGKGLSRLLALRRAPIELQALFNEVEALRCLLLIVRTSLRKIEATEQYDELQEPMEMLLRPVQRHSLDLQNLIEYKLAKADDTESAERNVSRTQWLRSASELQRLRQEIRDARGNLEAGLAALSLSAVGSLQQTALQIQAVSLTTQRELSSQLTQHGTPEARQDSQEVRLTQQLARLCSTRALPTSGIRHGDPVVTVKSTVSTQKCPRLCRCSCHRQNTGQTPTWLRGILGRLLYNYSALLWVKKCDFPPCQTTSRKMGFTWFLPGWIAARALVVAGNVNDIYGVGASWSLRVPAVIPSDSTVIQLVTYGRLSALQEAFSDGQTPWVVDRNGRTLLHYAANQGRADVYNFLIESGVSNDGEDKLHATAISYALNRPDHHRFKLDTDVLAEELGFTPLHLATALPTSELSLTPRLLEQEFPSVDVRDKQGQTALHWACMRGDSHSVSLLLEWNADITLRDYGGSCAIHYAAFGNNAEIVRKLLLAKADPNPLFGGPYSPLHLVTDLESIDALLQHGANLEQQAAGGDTPLCSHVRDGTTKVAVHLLKRGAEILAADKNDHNCAHLAVQHNGHEFLEHLIPLVNNAAAVPVTDGPPSLNHQNTLDSFGPKVSQHHGNPFSKVTRQGQTVLHLAALYAHPATMRQLARADLRGVDADRCDNNGDSPDHCFRIRRGDTYLHAQGTAAEEEGAWTVLTAAARATTNSVDWSRSWDVVDLEARDAQSSRLVTLIGHDNDDEDEFVDAVEDAGSLS